MINDMIDLLDNKIFIFFMHQKKIIIYVDLKKKIPAKHT